MAVKLLPKTAPNSSTPTNNRALCKNPRPLDFPCLSVPINVEALCFGLSPIITPGLEQWVQNWQPDARPSLTAQKEEVPNAKPSILRAMLQSVSERSGLSGPPWTARAGRR